MTTNMLFTFLGFIIIVAILSVIIAIVASVSGSVSAIIDDENTLAEE